jgi:hypothetical protein
LSAGSFPPFLSGDLPNFSMLLLFLLSFSMVYLTSLFFKRISLRF